MAPDPDAFFGAVLHAAVAYRSQGPQEIFPWAVGRSPWNFVKNLGLENSSKKWFMDDVIQYTCRMYQKAIDGMMRISSFFEFVLSCLTLYRRVALIVGMMRISQALFDGESFWYVLSMHLFGTGVKICMMLKHVLCKTWWRQWHWMISKRTCVDFTWFHWISIEW